MSSPHRTPPRIQPARDSTASGGGFTSIGNMLASPYDEPEPLTPTIATPQSPQRSLYGPPRIGTVRGEMYTPPGKSDLFDRVRSFEGEVEGDEYEDEGEVILAFDRPSPHSPARRQHHPHSTHSPGPGRQSKESGRVRPPTIIDFPEPTLASPIPLRTHSHTPSPAPNVHFHPPSTPTRSRINPAPQRPHIQIPQMPNAVHSPSRHDQYFISALPCSGTPISPHLAAPPMLLPPQSPFARPTHGSRDSIGSDSIQGFDMMKEKKALFRGGEEELLTPFSPRKAGRQESGPRPGATRTAMRAVSGADFWKRFSVSVRLDEVEKKGGKESQWLNEAQRSRKKIRWLAISAISLAVIIGASVGAGVALT